MTRWIRDRFGYDSVPWFYFTAAITLCVAGIVGTIVFGVLGMGVGLAISIPTIIVAGIGTLISGLVMDDAGYL